MDFIGGNLLFLVELFYGGLCALLCNKLLAVLIMGVKSTVTWIKVMKGDIMVQLVVMRERTFYI